MYRFWIKGKHVCKKPRNWQDVRFGNSSKEKIIEMIQEALIESHHEPKNLRYDCYIQHFLENAIFAQNLYNNDIKNPFIQTDFPDHV